MVSATSVEMGVEAVVAVSKFAYNVNADEFAQAVYGREVDGYTMDKFKAMQTSLTHYFGSLDEAHRRAFIRAALERQAKQ